MSEMKSKELIDKYGSEVALIIVKEIIKEYDERICNCGYDHDHDMWDAQRMGDWRSLQTLKHKTLTLK